MISVADTLRDARGPWEQKLALVYSRYEKRLAETGGVDFDDLLLKTVRLLEDAPDVLLLPGPGNSLGGICGQLVVAEGYRGVRSREEFEAAQRSEAPIVLSMRR